MYYEIDVDDKSYIYQIMFDYTCMLSIGCKPMMFFSEKQTYDVNHFNFAKI
jgi:hypothetical protein